MAESPESTVLEEEVDEDYEPSDEEVVEFANWLGMDLPEEQCLLWIAKEGLKAPLPCEWKPCRTEEDEIYYFNFDTGQSSWDHPCDEFFRSLYKKEAEKKRQLKQPLREQKKETGMPASPSGSSARKRSDTSDQMNRPTGASNGATQEGNSRPQQSGLVVRWKAATKQAQQDKAAAQAQALKETRETSEVNNVEQAEAPGSYKSMQSELLEKIKLELQEEGGNLMEQKRKEVIEEVERQIEMERHRLREMQNAKLQSDLAREQQLQEQKELERKRAWEAKLKDEEDELFKMNMELDARKKKIDQDLGVVLELENKSFEAESRVRMDALRETLKEEETKLLELEKEAILRSVTDKIRVAESVAMESMKEEALSRMKYVVSSLSGDMYQRELSLVTASIRAQVECTRKQRQMQIRKEVEDEMAKVKEEIVRGKREEMLQELRDRIIADHQVRLQQEQSRDRVVSPEGDRAKRPSARREEHLRLDASELVNLLQKSAWEVLLNMLLRRKSNNGCCQLKTKCNCEDRLKRSMSELQEGVQQAMLGIHEELAGLKRHESL